ncbi:M16 family metallopeptidase [Nitrospirota bacterium]
MVNKQIYIFFLVALLLLCTTAWAAAPGEVTERTLPNGLKVLLVEDHKSPLSIFQIWYRVGSKDEPAGLSGLSHLLEHMMFKGTEQYGTKVLSRTVNRNGGVDNAFTSKDYTAYFQILPSDRIGLSLKFESDRMRNLLLKADETLAERNVVMEERRLRYEDVPRNSLDELVTATAFNVHPYSTPVVGWMSDLENITPEDLYAHYRKFYSPDNAFIVAVGDFDTDKLFAEIEKYFGSIPSGNGIRTQKYLEPEQKGIRRVYLKKEAQLPYLVMAFHVPNFPHKDSFALDVMSEILGGGKSSRLHKDIVYNNKKALGVSAGYYGTMRDPYLLEISGTATDGTTAEELEGMINNHIGRIMNAVPSEFELQKAKNRLEATHIMQQDSIYSQAMILGWSEMTMGWEFKDDYLKGIREVTAEDIKRVARKYMIEDNSTVGILIPQKSRNQPVEAQ